MHRKRTAPEKTEGGPPIFDTKNKFYSQKAGKM